MNSSKSFFKCQGFRLEEGSGLEYFCSETLKNMFLFIKISAISCSGNQLNGNDILRKREENLMLNIHYFGVYHKFQKIFREFFCIS